MKRTRSIISFALLVFVTSGLNAQSVLRRRLDSVMQLAHQRGIFNGNVLVARHGRILYEKSLGFADGARSKPLHAGLRFDIGSVSKEFNGVSILLLQERGLLRLDDPISRYLPELPAWANRVHIRHLINYTSGIPVIVPLATENDSLIRKNLQELSSLAFEPGTAYIYNHYNVYLQMRIVERVSGMSYADFVTRNILRPCGMTHSQVDYPATAPEMARAFDSEFNETPYAQGMTGWVRLTARDLFRFTERLDQGQLISKASYRELAASFPGGESSLGKVEFSGDAIAWHQHQGSNSNYEAFVYSEPTTGITLVMTTNQQQMKVYGLKSALLAVLKQEPVSVPKKSVYLEVRDKFLADMPKGLTYYDELKANHQDQYDFSFELGDLISSGKYLQRRLRFDDALVLFQKALDLPGLPADRSYACELMGECYLKKGRMDLARAQYEKALQLDPKNKNAAGIIATLPK